MVKLRRLFMMGTVLLSGIIAAAAGMPFEAQSVKARASSFDDLAFARPELRVAAQHQTLENLRLELPADRLAAFDAFFSKEGVGWRVIVDRLSGRPALLEGRGIPWIPGTANHLDGTRFGLEADAGGRDVPLVVVAEEAQSFLKANPGIFGVDPKDLSIMPSASGPVSDYLYFLDLQWVYHGIPVEHAHLVFRLNHGNLVQVGQEFIGDSIRRLDPEPTLSRETAWEIFKSFIGGGEADDQIVEPGRLLVVPVTTPEASSGVAVAPGTGLEYRLVYAMAFRRPGSPGTWEGRVDAHTGEVLSFRDLDRYGTVHGGVYPGDRPSAEVDRPFPYADIGGGSFSGPSGLFAGTTATSTLNGQYVEIQDNNRCGPISLSTVTGDLNFGMSAGTDCTTPGFGGAGNNHAARTQFYQVNLIKMKGRAYLPANAWLQAKLLDKVNLINLDSSYCPGNAWWNGTNINFCKSGGIYGNTGEIPGVSLHEYGHGLDANDGNGSSPENGTGETYGDFTAILQTHSSCVGAGFYIGYVCGGYGDSCNSCSGIRDVDYAQHANNTPVVPDMLDNATGYHCGLDAGYHGPCGYEGHCESYVSTEGLWDLVNRDLVTWGMDVTSAWQLVDGLWYRTRPTATSAYSCPTLTTTDGCGVGSLFTVFRVADDCDGNLANGTPHASAIYAAFNRHDIACSSVVNTDQNCCPSLGSTSPVGVLGTNSVSLFWSAVSGTTSYNVYRNETSCAAGFTLIANTASTSIADATVAGGVTYYYRIQAQGPTASCTGPMGGCLTIGGPLTATSTASPSIGIAPLNVNLSGAGHDGTPPYTYSWNFGDGSPAGSGASVSHAYATGSYTAVVTVTDSASPAVTATSSEPITVYDPVVATAGASPTSGLVPFNVSFTGSATGGDGGPYTWDWDFGDGSAHSTAQNPTHNYTVAGTYTVILTATDGHGFSDTDNHIVIQACELVCTATVPLGGIKTAPVVFAATASTGPCAFPVTFAWDFGDGFTSTSQNPSHQYAATGTYTWTLTVTSGSYTCTRTGTVDIFDAMFYDDVTGQAQVCITFGTGDYLWTIMAGPLHYTGRAEVINGGAGFWNGPADPNFLYAVYDPVRHTAYAYYYVTGTSTFSGLWDHDTTDYAVPCGGGP